MIGGEYYRLEPITDMLYITAFLEVQFVLMGDMLTPALQNPERFRAKASEGEVVVFYFEPSATQDLNLSGFPVG